MDLLIDDVGDCDVREGGCWEGYEQFAGQVVYCCGDQGEVEVGLGCFEAGNIG